MIILQAANFVSPSSGGIRTALDALAGGYVQAGHRVVQVFPGVVERRRASGGVLRVELPSVPIRGTGYRLIVERRRLQQLLTEWAPDRVEVSDKLTLRWLGPWARERGVGSLLWTHERIDALAARSFGVPAPKALRERFTRGLARDFDAVVAPSDWAAEEFRRLVDSPVHVVPLGVDLATFHPAHADDRLRAELAGGAEVLLASAVRLSAEKDPDVLAATLRCLRDAGVDAALVVAGDGSRRRAMERAVRGLPVRLLGHVASRTDVAAVLATADVVLAPGPVETFGLAALEALACGTPVVGRRTGAVREVVGDAGLTAYGHPRSLAAAVERLLGRDAVERRAAARARAEGYPWSAAVHRMLQLHGAAVPTDPAVVGVP